MCLNVTVVWVCEGVCVRERERERVCGEYMGEYRIERCFKQHSHWCVLCSMLAHSIRYKVFLPP